MTPSDRIYRYVENYFQRSGCTAFPTVREVARGLHLRQSEIIDLVEGDGDGFIFLSGYNIEDIRDSDLYVETYEKP